MRNSVIFLVKRRLREKENEKFLFHEKLCFYEEENEKQKRQIEELNSRLADKLEQLRRGYFVFEDMRKEYERIEDEYARLKEEKDHELKHKDSLMGEYQKTIHEQRLILEKKQGHILKLEERVFYLTQEIKGLLQIESEENMEHVAQEPFPYASSPLSSTFDLSLLLSKCIEKAETLSPLDNRKAIRFLDLSFENYAADKRWLYDSFDDDKGIIFIYSQAEKKFLFANRFVKTALGWSPEKFMRDFPELVTIGFPEWKIALSKIYAMKETALHLVLKNKLGKNISFDCVMSLVNKGLFAHHVMGILHPDQM